MEYILADKRAAGCVLCARLAEPDGEENLILARRGPVFLILNKFPYMNGHVMAAPVRHVARPPELTNEERAAVMDALAEAQEALEEAMRPDGFNIGANLGRVAGAGDEDHLHFHVVPRWSGDHNFMPVLGLAHVMPEHLRETYRKLAPIFARGGVRT
ncbi:MAG: HIT domain-containing protein [Candidatus Methylomirabilis sp.]|nr:HIT domain-containing protein [Deltaproteobacteria bacterium]